MFAGGGASVLPALGVSGDVTDAAASCRDSDGCRMPEDEAEVPPRLHAGFRPFRGGKAWRRQRSPWRPT